MVKTIKDNLIAIIILVAVVLFLIWVFMGALDKTATNRQNYYCQTAIQTENQQYLDQYCQ